MSAGDAIPHSKEAGLFAHSYRVADGDNHAEGTHMLGHGLLG